MPTEVSDTLAHTIAENHRIVSPSVAFSITMVQVMVEIYLRDLAPQPPKGERGEDQRVVMILGERSMKQYHQMMLDDRNVWRYSLPSEVWQFQGGTTLALGPDHAVLIGEHGVVSNRY